LHCDNLKSHLLPRWSHKLFPLYFHKELSHLCRWKIV